MSENQRINLGGQQLLGVDMCCQHAKLVEMPNCIAARYDAGIINHKYEHTGVVEVIHLGKIEDLKELIKCQKLE